MRIFSAIEIPKRAKQSIGSLKEKISNSASIKWVDLQNLHVTLKFFGEVESINPVEGILKHVAQSVPSFEISLNNLGAFPSRTRVRVLWIGVEKGKEEIKKIFDLIENSAIELGLKKEKRGFTPHITMGRVKRGKLSLPDIDFSYPPYRAKRITLFHSTLTPKGPIYEVIARFWLK